MDKDKIIQTMKDISDSTSKAGSELEDSLKWFRDNVALKLNLWNKEIELNKTFEYLGKLYYKSLKSNDFEFENDAKAILQKLDNLILDIEILKGETNLFNQNSSFQNNLTDNEEDIFELPKNLSDD